MSKMMELKEDPELKPIFDDIEANGAAAMEKYWNDTDLMSKISQKMSAMNLGPATPPRKQENTKVRRWLIKGACSRECETHTIFVPEVRVYAAGILVVSLLLKLMQWHSSVSRYRAC